MAPGGVAVLPLPPRRSHDEELAPTSTFVLWAYTDLSDPRWYWGRRCVLLRQDPTALEDQKIGAPVPDGWTAYARAGHLFVKTFAHVPQALYPDLGASVELFTNAEMLEVETLGPLVRLAPGDQVEHIEAWHLFDRVPEPETDADVERSLLPLLDTELGLGRG